MYMVAMMCFSTRRHHYPSRVSLSSPLTAALCLVLKHDSLIHESTNNLRSRAALFFFQTPQACALICESYSNARFVIPIASSYLKEPVAAVARSVLHEASFTLWEDESAVAMMASDIAITKTGSASMELALLEVCRNHQFDARLS